MFEQDRDRDREPRNLEPENRDTFSRGFCRSLPSRSRFSWFLEINRDRDRDFLTVAFRDFPCMYRNTVDEKNRDRDRDRDYNRD